MAIRYGPYRCPTTPLDNRLAGLVDIVGCGSFNTTASFEHGILVVDCNDCGIWFEPAKEQDEVAA